MRDVTAGSESVLELLPLVFADPGEGTGARRTRPGSRSVAAAR